MASKLPEKSQESLSYVAAPPEEWKQTEDLRDKMIRRTKENPLVPIGV